MRLVAALVVLSACSSKSPPPPAQRPTDAAAPDAPITAPITEGPREKAAQELEDFFRGKGRDVHVFAEDTDIVFSIRVGGTDACDETLLAAFLESSRADFARVGFKRLRCVSSGAVVPVEP